MKTRVKDLLSEALALAPEDRADLAGRLLDTLEPEDPGVEKAWHAEIRRRIEELDSGAVEPMSAEEARSRIFRLRDASSDA
jgi:putative addiction module component (TIGR02574 family)